MSWVAVAHVVLLRTTNARINAVFHVDAAGSGDQVLHRQFDHALSTPVLVAFDVGNWFL
jgi:hypothetical protein